MFENMRVSHAVWYGIGAVVCWVIATTTTLPVWIRALAMGIGVVLLAATCFAFAFAGVNIIVGHRVSLQNAANNTDEVRKLEAIARMNEDQTSFSRWNYPALVMKLAGDPEPIRTIEIYGEQITQQFAYTFFADTWLNFKPVRDYGDGTVERRWATALTGYMVMKHYADPAGANFPAHWLNDGAKRLGLKSIGLEME
jgi:hypothetical protein